MTTPLPSKTFATPPPERPDDNACCQSGCDPCIFDLYYEELEAWRVEKRAWEAQQADAKA